jgi:hypothetical protein
MNIRKEERSTGDREEYAGRRNKGQQTERNMRTRRKRQERIWMQDDEDQKIGRNIHAGRKKNWRQGGICIKEERRTADKEGICRQEE